MATPNFNYPEVKRNESLVDELHGLKIADPYRDLEDPKSDTTKLFVQKQNELTEPFLEQCPHRSAIREILTKGQNFPRSGPPFKRGSNYYFFMNTGLQPQPVLYQQKSLDSEPTVFFDPNLLSSDGTVSLNTVSFSPNGEYFAYALSHSGSDWVEISVKHVPTGKDLDDKLTRAKFTGIEWTHDNNGFFYAMYPSDKDSVAGTDTDSNKNHTIYYHLLNTKQSKDSVKVKFPDHPTWIIGVEVSHDGKYLNVQPKDGCQDNIWYYCSLDGFNPNDELVLKPLYTGWGNQIDYITNNGDTFYFKTNIDAQNRRIAKLNLNNPAKENWVDVIPNHESDVLDWAEVFTVESKDYILINYLKNVVHHLELRELEGKVVKKFELPMGTIGKYDGRRNDGEIFFSFTSFLTPGISYRFDLHKLDSEPVIFRENRPKNFNHEEFMIEQVFYKGKDGTDVPMFIIHRKDMKLDGNNPCILYGYGGFNIKITSSFNINRIAWIKNFKGILAVANIRGGGELGQKWHDGGRLLNKQNSFDDFAAAAEYLIEKKYTRQTRLAIEGGSNGGLLVAATSNQRPDLFGATICHVGVLDMTRFTKFTIGHAWTSDYGDPDQEVHLKNLYKFSPYHNIPEETTKYPATLLLTADHDDRVVPAHSLKFVAQLQYKLGHRVPETPLLIRVDTKAGHGGGKPVTKVIEEFTDIYSFLYNVLKLEDHFSRD